MDEYSCVTVRFVDIHEALVACLQALELPMVGLFHLQDGVKYMLMQRIRERTMRIGIGDIF